MSKQNYNRFIQALRQFNSPERMDHEIGHDELKSFMEEKSKNVEEKVFTAKEIKDIKSESIRYSEYIQMILEEMIDEHTDEGGYYILKYHAVIVEPYIHKDFIRCMRDEQFADLINSVIMDYPSIEECVSESTILGRDIKLDLCHEQLLAKWMIERSKGPICTLVTLLDATEDPEEMAHVLIKKVLQIETEDYLDIDASYDMSSDWYKKDVSDHIKDILVNSLLNQLDANSINSLLEYRYRVKLPYTLSLVNVIFADVTAQQLYNYITSTSEKVKIIESYINPTNTQPLNEDTDFPIYDQLKLSQETKGKVINLYSPKYEKLKTLIHRTSNSKLSKKESKLIRELPREVTHPLVDIIVEEILNTDFQTYNSECHIETNNTNINTEIFSALKQTEIKEIIERLVLSYEEIDNSKSFIEFCNKGEYVSLQDMEHELDRLVACQSSGPALYLSIALQKAYNPEKALSDLFKRLNEIETYNYKTYCLAVCAMELKYTDQIKVYTKPYLDSLEVQKLIRFFEDFDLGTERPRTPLEYIFMCIPDKVLIDYATQTLDVEKALIITQYMNKKGVTERIANDSDNKLTFW